MQHIGIQLSILINIETIGNNIKYGAFQPSESKMKPIAKN